MDSQVMEPDERLFWSEVRRAVHDEQPAESAELAAAELELEALAAEAAQALPAPQIDALVAAALARDADLEASAPQQDLGVPAPVHRFPALRRLLMAAAALFVAPKFLVAATIVTAVAVTTFVVRYSAETLSFQDAVHLMLDEREPVTNRDPAQGRVAGDLWDSIGFVRAVVVEGGPLGEQAEAVLRRLRAEAETPAPFVRRSLLGEIVDLQERLVDRQLDVAQRMDALARLAEWASYGLSALAELEIRGAPDELLRDNRVVRRRILRELQR